MNSQDPTTTPTTQNDSFDVFRGGLHNMPITYEVPLIRHRRINKIHPFDNVIGNIKNVKNIPEKPSPLKDKSVQWIEVGGPLNL